MKNIHFSPWVGNEYENRELYGLKILVLGESHYGKPDEDKPGFTVEVIRYWAQTVRYPFFTKIAKLLLGKGTGEWLSDAERREFWEKVAFYNYIQELVGDSSRVRPTESMWLNAKPALSEVCEMLKPELILALGKDLEWYVSKIGINYPICYVSHPSGPFCYANEAPKLKDAVNRLNAFNNSSNLTGADIAPSS